MPDLSHEMDLWKKGYVVIGIDEVGRGAFAGPLFVGGVILNPNTENEYLKKLGIDDSKKVKPAKRILLSKIIQKESLAFQISQIDVPEINRIGIGKATYSAMRHVVKSLCEKYPAGKKFVLVDGFYIKRLRTIGLKNQKGIIHGDGISFSIAAASIIAKVARDNYMKILSKKFPEYGWGRNKGYGSLEHRLALRNQGATPLHRTDFIERFVISKSAPSLIQSLEN